MTCTTPCIMTIDQHDKLYVGLYRNLYIGLDNELHAMHEYLQVLYWGLGGAKADQNTKPSLFQFVWSSPLTTKFNIQFQLTLLGLCSQITSGKAGYSARTAVKALSESNIDSLTSLLPTSVEI